MKASDISDSEVLEAMKETLLYENLGSSLWNIQAKLAQFPGKVVTAKLRSMLNRGLIRGCCCGCRGDFRELK